MHVVMHFFMHVCCVNSIKYKYEYKYEYIRPTDKCINEFFYSILINFYSRKSR